MEHTKGEWEVNWHTTMNLPYKYTVSEEQETDEEAEANAKLIAAAPELLEALESFIDANDRGEFAIDAEIANKAMKAINKAKGK